MMALQDGFPSASGLADANDVRLALAGLVVRDSSGNPRTGIFFRNTTALVTSTATMNSSVAAFEAAVSRSGQGVILLHNNGATNVLHNPAPVANSRYDTIYVKQNDSVSPNADADDLPVFGILEGTPSASPTLPTWASAKAALDAAPGIGAGAEPLTAVLIPSTATSMQSSGVVYTQLYQYTAATGGVVPFRSKAELDLWTTATTGQRALVLSGSKGYQFDGAAWKPIAEEQQVCALRKSAPQNLTISAAALTWDVEISDLFGMHDNLTNTSRIVAPADGLYEVVATLYNNNLSGLGTVYARKNGSTDVPGSFDRGSGDSAAGLPLKTIFPVQMAANDYIEVMVLHATATGTIAGGTATGAAVVSMKRMGA